MPELRGDPARSRELGEVVDVRCHEHAILLVRAFEQLLFCRTEDVEIPKVIRVDSVCDQRNRSRCC